MTNVTAVRVGKQIWLQFPYDEELVAIVKSLPQRRFYKKPTRWEIPLCDLEILKVALNGRLTIDASLNYPRRVSYGAYTPKTEPREYQRLGAEMMAPAPYFAVFDEMGTGKTRQALDAFGILESRGKVKKMLVVAPNRAQDVWIREALKHSWFEPQILIRDVSKWRDAQIDVVNYEKVIIDEVKTALRGRRYDVIVADEAHRLANTRTQTFAAMNDLDARFKWALTGTPFKNGFSDVRGIGNWLGNVFGSYTAFMKRYTVVDVFDPNTVQYVNIPELQRRIKSFSLRRRKADVLPDLPPKQFETVHCVMTPEQELRYDEMRRRLETEITTELGTTNRFEVEQMIAKMVRLQQISSTLAALGGIDESGKLDEVCSMARDLVGQDSKVVIWSKFVATIEALGRRLNDLRPAFLYGGTGDRFKENYEEFVDGKAMVLIANPQVGGVGIDLQNASYELVVDATFSYTDYVQMIDRCHRIGQKNAVTIYNFASRYGDGRITIDDHVFGVLVRKASTAAEGLGDPTPVIDFADGEALLRILASKEAIE